MLRTTTLTIGSAIALTAASALGACAAPPPSNEALFAIQQSVASTNEDGRPRVTAVYEILQIDSKGQQRTKVPGASECYLEDPATRLGSPRGINTGTAVFSGGALPPSGLRVLPENTWSLPSVLDGQGWRGGERIDFSANGFSGETTASLLAPAAHLQIRFPAAPAESKTLELSGGRDVRIEWAPVPNKVGVRLATTAGDERRLLDCFFDGAAGVGIVPSAGVEKLPAVDGVKVTGALQITTRGQSYTDEDDWRLYVIATTLHTRWPFVTTN